VLALLLNNNTTAIRRRIFKHSILSFVHTLRHLSSNQTLRPLPNIQIDSQIQRADADKRQKELNARRRGQIAQVVMETDLTLIFTHCLIAIGGDKLPENNGWRVIHERYRPHCEHDANGVRDLLVGQVLEAARNHPVAVERDDDDAEDAGAAYHVVQDEPAGAEETAEHPVVVVEEKGGVGGYEKANQQVGY